MLSIGTLLPASHKQACQGDTVLKLISFNFRRVEIGKAVIMAEIDDTIGTLAIDTTQIAGRLQSVAMVVVQYLARLTQQMA